MNIKQPIAAIDIGSNSVHMVIATLERTGHLQILDTEKVGLQLGAALDSNFNLPSDVIDNVIQTLTQFQLLAKSFNALIRVVATHALREANNADDLLTRAKAQLDLDINVIDGVEEARLCYLGVSNSIRATEGTNLNIDIGGGSTEISIWKGHKLIKTASLKVGAVTLTKHLKTHHANPEQYRKELERFVLVRLAPISTILDRLNIDLAIASSGTAKSLATIHAKQRGNTNLREVNGYEIRGEELDDICAELIRLHKPSKIRNLYALDQSRSEIITAGAFILKTISNLLGVKSWQISSFALREGLVFDTIDRLQLGLTNDEKDIRWSSVLDLGRRFSIDSAQARAVSDLATNIYKKIQPWILAELNQQQQISDLTLLRCASYLFEVGKSIGHPKHHHHAAYIISNASLLGFTQPEKNLISAIIRFHRKRAPNKEKARDFSIKESGLRQLKILSSCLRIAAALSRTRRSLVKDIEISIENSLLQLVIVHDKNEVPSAEFWKLIAEQRHLEKSLDVRMSFVLRPLS